jgi:diguanylate cyclase (GGDEF)-like protein
VDRFKLINDTHGHLAGDQVLRHIAQVLDGNVRKVDYCARYGGEEFAVIAPCTPQAGLLQLAERLRQSVESSQLSWESIQFRATISLGAVVAEKVADTSIAGKELLRVADKLLYEAKCAGRNQVVSGCWPEPDQGSKSDPTP